MHEDGPAAVYAGPGSGKTRVVTLRAARMAQAGRRLLVTTFTNDATSEMRSRLGRLLDKDRMRATEITTLHALCLRLLRSRRLPFTLLTDEAHRRNLAAAAQAADLEGGVSGFLMRQSYVKNCGVSSKSYRHDGSFEDMDFARIWRAYEKAKADKGMLEFDDLILEAAVLLESDESFRKQCAERYTHIVVDECQDMNAPQYSAALALGRDHKNVMLVGDMDQSLYGFRGADTETFKRFAANRRTQVYELRENYRSTQSIIAFAGALIRQDAERRPVAIVAMRPEGEPVTWQRLGDPDLEAVAVGEHILQLIKRGARPSEIAVLYRVNAQSEAFERNFTAMDIPYTIRDEGDFYSRREVQGMLAYLQFFAARGDREEAYPDEWLLAVLNVPNRKLPGTTGSQLSNHAAIRGRRIWDILPEFHAADLRSHKALRSLQNELQTIDRKLETIAHAGEAVKIVRAVTDFDGWLRRGEGEKNEDERVQNLQRMQAAAAHYPYIGDYLAAVQRVRDESARRKSERAKKRREQDEVTLGTGHSAKGLEWRFVFAAGWSEQLLPHRKAENIAEERRIAYVMATRARDQLWISSTDTWNDSTVAPSRFLSELQIAPPPAVESAAPVAAAETPDTFGGLFLSS
jgi:DNA helicase-2/ATP-dependent DNA helicase PcrA